jgi:hypothetical protein
MNKPSRRTILYGDTLVLAGVRANLEQHPDLEVLVFDRPLKNPAETFRSFCPATVIFDLEAIPTDFPLSLLQQPELTLIGIDPESHQALVWAGRQTAAVWTGDLVEIVHNKQFSIKDTEIKAFAFNPKGV